MSSRGASIAGSGCAATNARAASLRGHGVPLMAAKLSQRAIACCPLPPHEIDRPARADIETARRRVA